MWLKAMLNWGKWDWVVKADKTDNEENQIFQIITDIDIIKEKKVTGVSKYC